MGRYKQDCKIATTPTIKYILCDRHCAIVHYFYSSFTSPPFSINTTFPEWEKKTNLFITAFGVKMWTSWSKRNIIRNIIVNVVQFNHNLKDLVIKILLWWYLPFNLPHKNYLSDYKLSFENILWHLNLNYTQWFRNKLWTNTDNWIKLLLYLRQQ